MDSIWGSPADGLDGSAEAPDLLPQRLQTGPVAEEVDDRHLAAWVHLRRQRRPRGGREEAAPD